MNILADGRPTVCVALYSREGKEHTGLRLIRQGWDIKRIAMLIATLFAYCICFKGKKDVIKR